MPEAKVFRLSRSFEVWPSLLSWFWGWSTAGILELKFGCDPGTGLLSITGLGSLNIILQLWNIYWKEMRTTKEHIKAIIYENMTRIITESALVLTSDWINQSWIGLALVELSLAICSAGQPSFDWPFFFRGWGHMIDALPPRWLQPLDQSPPTCSTRAYFALSRRPGTRSSSGRR